MMNVLNIRWSSVLTSGTSKYHIHDNSNMVSDNHFASEQPGFGEVKSIHIS